MPNTQVEQYGYAAVHAACAAMNAVWRPTINNDLGIDGQLEFLESGGVVSTGVIVGVQIKSGDSYFRREREGRIVYAPSARHRRYWSVVNLPVLLILHDHDRALTVYAFVKQQLAAGGPIYVAPDDHFDGNARDAIIDGYREEMREIRRMLQPENILAKLARVRLVRDNPAPNGLHFLLAGVDDRFRYFEMRWVRIRTVLGALSGGSIGGPAFDEFIARCTLLCWADELIDSFEEDFEEAWFELGMMPDISVATTNRGRIVLKELVRRSTDLPLGTPKGMTGPIWARELIAMGERASEREDASDNIHGYWR